MPLSKAAVLLIRGSSEIKKQIVESQAITTNTLYNWLRDDSPNLTRAAVLAIIEHESGLAVEHLLSPENPKNGQTDTY